MNTTQTSSKTLPSPVETKLEVVVIPVADVERSKTFYSSLGWRLDADFAAGDSWRVVQLTPPGSPCSISIGKGTTTVAPGSAQGMMLVVDDVEAARSELVRRGVNVSEVFHFENNLLRFSGTSGRVPGRDPEGQSYFSWASFTDPDGNGWLLQEVKTRFPGRGFSLDVPTLTELLKAAEESHGRYQARAPKHHWSEWYAAYVIACQRGRTADEAARDATLHVEAAHP